MRLNRSPEASVRKQPNILILLVDEERYPPVYEHASIRHWREQQLAAHNRLARNSVTFNRHYIGSAACCPSRTTMLPANTRRCTGSLKRTA